MNVIKTIFALITTFALLVVIGLYTLSKNPIKISNDQLQKLSGYDPHELSIAGEDAKIIFADYKIQLVIPKLQLIKTNNHIINFEEFNLSWNVLRFLGQIDTNIKNSEILSLATISNQPKLSEYALSHIVLFDGNIHMEFNLLGTKEAELNLNNIDEGSHTPKDLPSIKLNQFLVSLVYKDNLLSVNKFQLQYNNNINIYLNGDFAFSGHSLTSAKFQTEITELPIKYLKGLWPQMLFPDIHEWVSTHVTAGIIKKANGSFNLTEKDLQEGTEIAKESINTEIEVKDAVVTYLDEYTPIRNLHGIVKIDGTALYFNTENALMLTNKIENLELALPFNDLILSLKANISGKISDFQEFIPNTVHNKLASYGINYKSIKGRASGFIDLKIPTDQDFKINNLQLYIKANLENVILDNLGLIELKKATIELINESEKLKLKINHKELVAFDLTQYHDPAQKDNNQININALLDINNQTKLNNLLLNKGEIGIIAKLNEEQWETQLNFTKAEMDILPLGYNKTIGNAASIKCSGNFEQDQLTSDNCALAGKDFSGIISFVYSYKNSMLNNLSLTSAKIGPNIFSYKTTSDKNFTTSYINAKNLDLSNYSFSNQNSPNYNFSFNIEKITLKNNINLSNTKGYITKLANKPLDISMHAFSDAEKITISKAMKNNKIFYSIHSTSAATFSQAFNIYKNIKKGELFIEFHPEAQEDQIIYSGNVTIKKFYLSNTSTLTKIILGILSPLNSPQAIAQSLQGGSLPADSFTAKLLYKQDKLTLDDGLIDGPSYQVKLNGYVDFNDRYLDFKGVYIPSFYGINTFISMIPLFGKLLAGGDKSAFIAANFGIKGSFDKPITSFNPLSIFTPGFLRNLFNH